MAAGLGLKTFVTGDVLTAADTNGYLMQGVWVFADAAARTAAVTSPQEGNMSYLKDTNKTEYYSGTAWVAVAGASGKLLQAVSATYSTQVNNSTTTFADTGLTATITPTLNTSKVLVLINVNGVYKSSGNANSACQIQLLRDATVLAKLVNEGGFTGTALEVQAASVSSAYLDSPATASATIYKAQFKNTVAAAAVGVQSGASVSTITLLEIGA
jgi:hypothetical protein